VQELTGMYFNNRTKTDWIKKQEAQLLVRKLCVTITAHCKSSIITSYDEKLLSKYTLQNYC